MKKKEEIKSIIADSKVKFCTKCFKQKYVTDFYKNSSSKDGYRYNCKTCHNITRDKWISENCEKYKENIRAYRSREDVRRHRATLSRAWNRKNLESVLLTAARKRAREAKVPCTIQKKDIFIPKYCPIFNIELKVADGKQKDCSPTLDRFIPSLGYVPGNIYVISHRANRIKSDADYSEIKKIYKWMKKYEGKK